MGLESSITWNIRNLLKVGFLHFLSSESCFLKYKRNIRLESSISGNIRKFRYARVLNIPFLKYKKSFVTPGFSIYLSWNRIKFCFLKYKDFFRVLRFLKYKKSFLLKKYKKLFNIKARKLESSNFPEYKKFSRFLLFFSSSESYFLKYKRNTTLENSISGNIRKLCQGSEYSFPEI